MRIALQYVTVRAQYDRNRGKGTDRQRFGASTRWRARHADRAARCVAAVRTGGACVGPRVRNSFSQVLVPVLAMHVKSTGTSNKLLVHVVHNMLERLWPPVTN